MSKTMTKHEAHDLVDRLPEQSTWDDLIHEIYVRQAVARGLEDSDAGRTRDVCEVRREYGLSE